jgi:Protein of unknown function (DUF3570)
VAAPVAALAALLASPARGEDYVSVRGAYYRETNTRVIQPMVEVERDSDSGVDVAAHYLVDAITSASAAAGVGVDSLFTEVRNEAGLRLRLRRGTTEASLGYQYSAESDYWSHGVGGSVSRRFWGDTARLTFALGVNLDSVSSRGRTPDCATPPSTSCALHGFYGGITYSQVLSPVLFFQISGETTYLDGFQGNLYRSVPNFGYERVPEKRTRSSISPRIAYYMPETSTGVQLQYRYYVDYWPGSSPTGENPWNVQAHMVEGRLFQQLTPELELRLSYRQYYQAHAQFWCDALANSTCYSPSARWYSTDPKLGSIHTEYPEVKLLWEASALASVPFFRWFSTGTFEISYGYYWQNDTFGNAHVLQTGYRMPY